MIFQLASGFSFSLMITLGFNEMSTISLLFIGTVNLIVPSGPVRIIWFVSGTSRVSSFKCAICAALSSLGAPISSYAE